MASKRKDVLVLCGPEAFLICPDRMESLAALQDTLVKSDANHTEGRLERP